MKGQIEWLLFSNYISNYRITKETGISAAALQKYVDGRSKIGGMTLDNALKLNEYFEEVKKDMESKYGTVTYEDIKYTLLRQPEMTGNELIEWKTEEGYAEFSAPAISDEGIEYEVRWQLKVDDVEDLTDLDWDNVYEVLTV